MANNKHFLLKFSSPLSAWQENVRWYVDESAYRFFIAVIGRQAGKSYLAKRLLLDRAVNHRQNCMWIAPSIPSVRGHWKDLVDWVKGSRIPVEKIREASKEMFFYGGGRIVIRSAIEPDNLRGPSLDFVVLDEAAFFRDGEYVWSNVVLPMLTATQGRALFTTTPNGRNWLWQYYMKGLSNDEKYYKSFHYTSMDSPFQDKKLLEELKNTLPSAQWRQEYEAEFLVDGGGVFAGVEAAATVDMLYEPVAGHTYLCGIDVGHNNNFTAITIVDKYTREQVFGLRFSDVGTTMAIKRIIEVLDRWQPERTYVETNGVGEHFFTLLKEVLSGNVEDINNVIADRTGESIEEVVGNHRLHGVYMNNELKYSLVNKLAGDIEYLRLKILNDKTEYGRQQMSEMSTYERHITLGGTSTTYRHKEGETDDTIVALYLVYLGMPKPNRWRIPKQASNEKRVNPFRMKGKRLKNARSN